MLVPLLGNDRPNAPLAQVLACGVAGTAPVRGDRLGSVPWPTGAGSPHATTGEQVIECREVVPLAGRERKYHRTTVPITADAQLGRETAARPAQSLAVLPPNGGTRSGKEILVDGFKRYGLGEVVGTRTAGAVLAARAFLLGDGSLLLLAVADVEVDGRRLEGVGVTPTLQVPFPLEYAQGADPQRDRAVELLARSLGG